jgi:hypothetical protein
MRSSKQIRLSYDEEGVPFQMKHRMESPMLDEGLKMEKSQEFPTTRTLKLPLLGDFNKLHPQSFTKTYLPKIKSALEVHHETINNWNSHFLNTIRAENEHIKSKLNEYTQYAKKM